MDELKRIIEIHLKQYPLLRPRDIYKLIYQGYFGTGHFIGISDAVEKLIIEATQTKGERRVEDIGFGYSRLYLIKEDAKPEKAKKIVEMFAKSDASTLNIEGFVSRLHSAEQILSLLNKKELVQSLVCFEEIAKNLGYPAVSHSEEYKKAYVPSYRVIRTIFVKEII